MTLLRSRDLKICSGPLLYNMFRFAVPIILSGILQTLFNTVDAAVVGRFGCATALASVGATASLTHLLINVFLGLSTGAGVATAQAMGAEDRASVARTIRTSVTASLVSGVLCAALGAGCAKLFLGWMGCPADVLPGAATYMRIYFVGMPAILLFNFGSSILRAMGDTKRPLYFLICAGAANMILNLIFVIPLHMDVAGVALATVLSQCAAAVLVLLCLRRLPADVRLDRLGADRQSLRKILVIGVPAGVQASLFSLSNVVLQSSINSLGATAVSASAAATNIDNFVYIGMNGVSQAATTFAGQNYGAGSLQRVATTERDAFVLTTVIGAGLGLIECLLGRQLLGCFTTDEAVIAMGLGRLTLIGSTYYLFGMMEATSSVLRGMGRSFTPMAMTLLGVCGLRIAWALFVFPHLRELTFLFFCYPLSWGATLVVLLIYYGAVIRKERRHATAALPAVS